MTGYGPDHHGYMNGEAGPFRCDHCEYYPEPNRCRHPTIIEWAKAKRFGLKVDGKLACVDPAGCSDFFERNPHMKETGRLLTIAMRLPG